MRAGAALILFLAAAVARAGDSPTPPQDSPPPDSIATAKKELAAIKALSAPTDSASALPTVDMKDIGPAPGAEAREAPATTPAETEASLDPSKKKEGTGNWLVDAMDKKSDRTKSPSGRDDISKGDAELLRDGDRDGSQGDRDAEAAQDARERAADKAAAQNPLDSFMGGWISARDHDLLVPIAKGDGAAGDAARASGDEPSQLDLGQHGLAEDILPAPDPGSWGDSKAPSNPFIALMDLDPAVSLKPFAAPDSGGLEAPAFPSGPVSSGVNPGPMDGARDIIPGFAQPSDDDKYFKQMKKF
jgi:hypothetical protein